MDFITKSTTVYYDGPQIVLMTSPETGADYIATAVYQPDFPSQEWPMCVVEIDAFDIDALKTDRTDVRAIFNRAERAWMCDLHTGEGVDIAIPLPEDYMVDDGLYIGDYLN